jgi:outer membrane lipoprotein carrier protein
MVSTFFRRSSQFPSIVMPGCGRILAYKQVSRVLRPVFALALIAALPSLAHAFSTNVRELAQRVDNRYDHINSLRADFTETYRGSGMERAESGTLWLKKPGKMLWQYRSPREKLFVSDGKTAWFYVPGDQQARKESAKKLDDLRSPFGFLLGKTKLEKELEGLSLAPDVAPQKPGNIVLRGVPKGMSGQISQILLEVEPDGQIDRVVMSGEDGSTTEYVFSNQKENVNIADRMFHFTPPSGVEVVEGELGQ